MVKALYIGCGSDTKFLPELHGVDELVCIDSLPITPCPYRYDCTSINDASTDASQIVLHNPNIPYNYRFLKMVENNYSNHGCTLVSNNDTSMVFMKPFQTGKLKIHFYHSTVFPHMSAELEQRISNYHVLIVDGFLPHPDVLRYAANTITFIGTSKTCYLDTDGSHIDESHSDNALYYALHEICTANKSKSATPVVEKWIKYDAQWSDDDHHYRISNKTMVTSIDDFL